MIPIYPKRLIAESVITNIKTQIKTKQLRITKQLRNIERKRQRNIFRKIKRKFMLIERLRR